MAGDKQNVGMNTGVKLYLDKMANPWQYREAELPTQTKHIMSRPKQGTIIDSNSGALNMGSLYFSGSHYDFGPGSTSIRIIRRTAAIGSMSLNTDAWWKLHHSRLGTVDALPFKQSGTLNAQYGVAQAYNDRGGPLNPIYAFPPGTLTHYMQSLKGTARVSASMEGIF